jgi:hypothetical protein
MMLDANSNKLLCSLKREEHGEITMEEFEKLLHTKLTLGELDNDVYGIRNSNQRQTIRKLIRSQTKPSERRREHAMVLKEISKPPPVANFRQINRDIKDFVRMGLDEDNKSLELEPQPPEVRAFVHKIAHLYGLKSTSSGKDHQRHCIISHHPSQVACVPRNLRSLDKILETAQKVAFHAGSSREKGGKKGDKKGGKKPFYSRKGRRNKRSRKTRKRK